MLAGPAKDPGRPPPNSERSETKGGHTYTKFYGRPITWMAPS